MKNIITRQAIESRKRWIRRFQSADRNFVAESNRIQAELQKEVEQSGLSVLLNHLRLCGDIPEQFGHDSSEEKLYSKYTDILLAETFRFLGLKSHVLTERADAADVEVFAKRYAFIADAKVFRMSRTAKNAKDFKIQSMDGWKRGKTYAMVVCPVCQLPNTSSQIYSQAITRNVCVFSYSHLAVMAAFSLSKRASESEKFLERIFNVPLELNPSKNANDYWSAVNRTMLGFSKEIPALWQIEKQAAEESVQIAKEAALTFLAEERERFIRMSHDEAIVELIKSHKIDNKIKTIRSVTCNDILTVR